ncbi:hypothetical protein C1N74_13660 [Microbacterium sp. SGAir0570]|jgi:hypothetical protein|uniref:glycosyltransferase family 77 protein n=1 Tax=Microbacterium sp. SGAir0570 TaxID=2070348 RepID=UPI0010CCE6F0|nr:glycosyltransferase family 77 protein [Microbacterium sp. SGAir0570]QCR41361.1 hypothetical protein C1N74_13660 [Microbacterium sp. SGAir0570]
MSALIYTVGQNGYDIAYRRCIASQRSYAARLGVTYAAVTEPKRMPDTAISAWLKIPLLLQALEAGYEHVAFIDADAEVRETAPDFRLELTGDADVAMALGRSGRMNSGVILARNGDGALEYFRRVMESIVEEIPDEARANLKYENGNVIYVTDQIGGVEVLDQRWNNTADPDLDDHVRHYTGPLRSTYKRNLIDELKFRLARARVARPTPQPATRSPEFQAQLLAAAQDAQTRYPALLGPGDRSRR